jgi:hypothetical protein
VRLNAPINGFISPISIEVIFKLPIVAGGQNVLIDAMF